MSKLLVAIGKNGYLALTKPIPCKRCHTMHYWFRNMNGHTLCLDCAATELVTR